MRENIPTKLLAWSMTAPDNELAAVLKLIEKMEAARARNSVVREPTICANKYVIRKGAGGWHLVFDGNEAVLPDEKGTYYTAHLLLHPPAEPLHASELAHAVFGDAVVENQRNLGMDDRDSLAAIAKARRECRAILEDDTASEMEKTEAATELERISEWARKHQRGTEGGEQKQTRAVRAAIRRLLEAMETATERDGQPNLVLRDFGRHLRTYLWNASSQLARRPAMMESGMAGRFTYEPPTGVEWVG